MKNYRDIVLVRIGEIVLKGLNRNKFEQRLLNNLRWRIRQFPELKIYQDQSRIYIESKQADSFDTESVIKAITKVFGVVSVSAVRCFASDAEILQEQVKQYARELWQDGKKHTFKLETKRINKSFPFSTYELNCELGGVICELLGDKAVVDVHEPEYTIRVEIREKTYLYHEIIPAHKGLPVGTGGKGLLLLSGGIDSPVAGYMLASRGMEIEGIYFHTFPYTSEQAKDKVIELARKLSGYCGKFRLHIVDFTDIQLAINDACPEAMLTIVMRRVMMRIAEKVALQREMGCLITGESLGQVASQTLEALGTTNCVVSLPVFRPLIGMDKEDTVAIARKIDTFETSILPYEDCCTVFVAKHPKTKPTMQDALKAEQRLDIDSLVTTGVERIETIEVY